MDIYSKVALLAGNLEGELKRLGRWTTKPLPDESFIDMGPFGSNTMSYEQWLQFVFLERVKEIVTEKDGLPDSSNLSIYGVRYFDGDPHAIQILKILQEIDQLINQ